MTVGFLVAHLEDERLEGREMLVVGELGHKDLPIADTDESTADLLTFSCSPDLHRQACLVEISIKILLSIVCSNDANFVHFLNFKE